MKTFENEATPLGSSSCQNIYQMLYIAYNKSIKTRPKRMVQDARLQDTIEANVRLWLIEVKVGLVHLTKNAQNLTASHRSKKQPLEYRLRKRNRLKTNDLEGSFVLRHI